MLGAPGTESEGVAPGSYVVDLFAALLCLLIAFVLNLGMRSAARFETFLVYLKVVVVLLVIVVGVFYIDAGNYNPFTPFGLSGAFAGAATVFFAVFGYDAMSTAAEESKDSQKHMPKAIIYSLAISMVLYVLACLVLTGMVNYRDINTDAAFSAAFASVGLPVLGAIIAAGAIFGHPDGPVHVPDGRLPGRVRDEPRRAAAGVVLEDPPRAQGADADHVGPRHRVRGDRGIPADQRGRGADEHRHPARVRRRLHRGDRAALPTAGPAANVPLPGNADRAGRRRAVLTLADQLPQPGRPGCGSPSGS